MLLFGIGMQSYQKHVDDFMDGGIAITLRCLFLLMSFNKLDEYITSLCFYPTGSILTIGLSSGALKSYKGLPSFPQLLASHSKLQVWVCILCLFHALIYVAIVSIQ